MGLAQRERRPRRVRAGRALTTGAASSRRPREDRTRWISTSSSSAPPARRRRRAAACPPRSIRRGGDRLLFDCGEGTQRQLLRSVGLVDLEEIFITHFHADHVLGLPGMLKTFGLRQRELPLTVYGPPGLARLFGALAR